jgi:hypothetical protein
MIEITAAKQSPSGQGHQGMSQSKRKIIDHGIGLTERG